MASSVLTGQAALCGLPPAPIHDAEHAETISTYTLPVQLKISQNQAKKKGTGSGILGNGMDVYKVSKMGKRQQRRVAISSDNRNLLISSNSGVASMFRRKRSGMKNVHKNDAFRKIEIFSIDRIVRGQMTDKFIKKKPKQAAATMKMPLAEDKLSLSIIFRINSAATDQIVEEEDLEVKVDSSNQMATLDLVIPSHNNYEIFVSTLKNLMILNHKYFLSMQRDILLLQHHWMEIGKEFDAKVNQSEWSTICCDRLSVDLGRNGVLSLYRKYCQAMKVNPEEGISLSKAVGLLEHTRKMSLLLKSRHDPCDLVWNRIESSGKGNKTLGKSDPLPTNDDRDVLIFSDNQSIGGDSTIAVQKAKVRDQGKKHKNEEEYISVQAFLNFMHNEQKERTMTLSDARMIFERLNAQTHASQLHADGVTRKSSSDSEKYSMDFITKTVFFDYLRSDINDAFDPVLGEKEHDDMSQPLNSYWVNACHDTYLKSVAPRRKQGNIAAPLDITMYTTALNRGARCLEVDVWDGEGDQSGEPVVRFDEDKSIGKGNVKKEGILFSSVMKTLRSFLASEPACLPIILFIETRCSISSQEKMVESIHSILGEDDMIFVPSDHDYTDEMALPSPNELRGKVVLKFKTPVKGSSKVIYDDTDDLNDIDPFGNNEHGFEDEKDIALLPGLDALGAILFESSRELENKDPEELVANAMKEAKMARKKAEAADEKAFNANVKVNRATDLSNKLMKKTGLTPEKIERKLNPTPPKKNAIKAVTFNEDDETVGDETLFSQELSVVPKKKENSLWSKMLGWVGTLDGTASEEGSYLEDREAADSMDDYSFDSMDERDDIDIDFDDDELFDVDVDVNTFSEFERNTMIDILERQAEYEREAKRKLESEDRLRKFQMQKGSISNVEKKLEEMDEEADIDTGVEVEHFYSSAIDETLRVHREAEVTEEDASKILGSATAVFNKRQQEYDSAKKNLDLVKKLKMYEDQLEAFNAKKNQAENASATAKSEFQISEERAVETVENASKAHQERDNAHLKEKQIIEKREQLEDALQPKRQNLEEKNKAYERIMKKFSVVKREHEKVSANIKQIEGSHRYKVEKREASRGALSDDTALRKHRMEVDKQVKLNSKLQDIKNNRVKMEQEVAEAEQAVQMVEAELDVCSDEAAKVKEFVDKYDTYVEQMDQLAEEEKDAAKLREEGSEKAAILVQNIDSQIHKLKSKLNDINLLKEDNMTSSSLAAYGKKCDKAKEKIDAAELTFKEAQESYKWADARLKDANELMSENSDALKKAKVEKVQIENRANANDALRHNAISSYERLKVMQKELDEAKDEAARLRLEAAEKVSALRRAKDYKQRLAMVTDISPKLADLSLLYSTKFKFFEDSMTLDTKNLHSISEGKMLQLLTNEPDNIMYQMRELNKTHLTRIYPSRHKAIRKSTNNFNPILPWSLGCQFVSMNQQVCDAFVLVNDARFRANGSCGYVLKPDAIISRSPRSHSARVPSKWQFQLLSASNLPKTRRKALAGPINPRVRITLYDGGCGVPEVHLSSTLVRNGFNPVWNEKNGAIFNDIKDPDCAVVLFSVWDHNEGGKEDFIAAAGIPLSCMREGYRSVPLFDTNYMRCGAHAFTSLFVHVSAH